MTNNMQERFKERFPLQQLHNYPELTGHLAKDGEMLAFIQSEIDREVAEERNRIERDISFIHYNLKNAIRNERDGTNIKGYEGEVNRWLKELQEYNITLTTKQQ